MRDNLYVDERLEAAVRSIISRFLIREDWCEGCKTETNMIRIQDCDDYWKCINCGGINKRKFSPVVGAKNIEEAKTIERKKLSSVESEDDDSVPQPWEIARAKSQLMAQELAKKEIEAERNKNDRPV
jgi:hypothetical protein